MRPVDRAGQSGGDRGQRQARAAVEQHLGSRPDAHIGQEVDDTEHETFRAAGGDGVGGQDAAGRLDDGEDLASGRQLGSHRVHDTGIFHLGHDHRGHPRKVSHGGDVLQDRKLARHRQSVHPDTLLHG